MPLLSWRYLALFLPAGWGIFRLLPTRGRPWLLLGLSLWFYWLACGSLMGELLLFAGVSWAAGRWMERTHFPQGRRTILLGAALLFGWRLWRVKYAPYLVLRWNAAGLPPLPYSQPAHALGLSFFSLTALGYLIEVCRGEKALTLAAVLSGLAFFPAVTEGPIGRLHRLAPQLMAGRTPPPGAAAMGAQRILWGLFKKAVVADRAAMLVNRVFDDYTVYGGWAVPLAAAMYTLQLYGEFSGVMDIVIGSAEGFGIALEENFRQPFFAVSVSDFWRRWHITLGGWLRDYLFQPVVLSPAGQRLSRWGRKRFGSRAGALLPVWVGLSLVWLAMGLWHGPESKYLFYGGYYGVLQLLGRWWEAKHRPALPAAWARLRTLLLVVIGMFIFRAQSLHAVFAMAAAAVTPWRGNILAFGLDAKDWAVLLAGTGVLLGVDFLHERGIHLRAKLAACPVWVRWGTVWCGLAALLIFGAYGGGYDPANLVYAAF